MRCELEQAREQVAALIGLRPLPSSKVRDRASSVLESPGELEKEWLRRSRDSGPDRDGIGSRRRPRAGWLVANCENGVSSLEMTRI